MFQLEEPGTKFSSSKIVPGAKKVPGLGLVLSKGTGTLGAGFAELTASCACVSCLLLSIDIFVLINTPHNC